MKLIPINQSFQPLINQWFTGDVTGQQELNSYTNLESWIKLLTPTNRWGWIVYEKNQAIGFLDLERTAEQTGYFSFYLAPAERGQGKSTAFLQTLIQQAKNYGIQRLEAGVKENNLASQRALETIGFTLNGTDKDNYLRYTLTL